MSKNLNVSIIKPKMKYITIEIKKTKIDENGHIYEIVEEQKVPEFLADILLDNGNIFIADN